MFLLSILFFTVSFFSTVSSLAAQSVNDDTENQVTALAITGLRRTRLSVAEQPLLKFIGLPADQVDPDDVWAKVMATGILEPLSVEIENGLLSVTVREKWSIFPIPVFFAGSDGIMGGLAFLDANAFGINDTLFMAGFYHPDGWGASGGYMHASQGRFVPGWNGFGYFSREERFDRNQRNEALRRFELYEISLGAGLNIPLLEDTDLLSASAQFSFNNKFPFNNKMMDDKILDKKISESPNTMNAPEESMRLFGIGGEIGSRRSSWDGFFLSQESASLRYSYRTSLSGFSYHSVRFRGAWEKSLMPGFRVSMKTGIVYEPEAPVLFESSPSAAHVAILPRNFSAKNYAGLSAGLEKYIFQLSLGTISLGAAYQAVYSEGSILSNSLDHGVVGMLTFYLSRIAVPAVGLGAAYNVKENYLQASFSIGMSF